MLPPVGPNGALRSQVAVFGLHNAYNSVIPPSWAHGYPKPQPRKPWDKWSGGGGKHCDDDGSDFEDKHAFEDQYAFDYGYE